MKYFNITLILGHLEKMESVPHEEKWDFIKVLAKFLQGLRKLRPPS